mgnify:CR=1 FL=1
MTQTGKLEQILISFSPTLQLLYFALVMDDCFTALQDLGDILRYNLDPLQS